MEAALFDRNRRATVFVHLGSAAHSTGEARVEAHERLGRSSQVAELARRARQIVKAGRFNTREQHEWAGRAEAAVALCVSHWGDGPLRVADIGAGNERVRDLLTVRGVDFTYEAFDLHPQQETTAKLDITQEVPPGGPYSVVFCLGVLEYLPDARDVIARLAGLTEGVVHSYLPLDGPVNMSRVERSRRGWKSHLTHSELEAAFHDAGMKRVDHAVVDDGRTDLWCWAARSPPPAM